MASLICCFWLIGYSYILFFKPIGSNGLKWIQMGSNWSKGSYLVHMAPNGKDLQGLNGFKLVNKKVQIGQHGFKWVQMGSNGSIGSNGSLDTVLQFLPGFWQFLGNFGQGAHDDVWRYIAPCGGERLALQSLIPRHWIHPAFQGQPMIILPILIPSASSCKPSLRITEKVKRDHNPFFSFSYFWI